MAASLFALILAFSPLAGLQAAPAKLRVAIVQPMSHTSLNQIRDTIVAELKASGRAFEIVYQDAHGDTSSLATIFQNIRSKGVDIVVPIATPSAQSAKNVFGGARTPIVFAAVSDPVAAGLTGDDCKNITGVSNSIPSAKIVQLISDFQPKYKKIGFLYTSSETNSVSTIKAAKAYCDKNGIAYAEAAIASASDLVAAVNSLAAKGVDALYTGNDNTIASAMPAYTDAAYAKGVPIYCGADSMVADGGLATIGIDYVQLGKQVAAMVLKVADGTAPSALPYETLSDYAKFVNLKAADKLRLALSPEILKRYTTLVEKDGTSHFGK
jgi:putative ABC transport system substrate-binding protein